MGLLLGYSEEWSRSKSSGGSRRIERSKRFDFLKAEEQRCRVCFSCPRPLSRTANAAEIARSHWLQSCRGVGDGYVQVRCSCLTEGYACIFSVTLLPFALFEFFSSTNVPLSSAGFPNLRRPFLLLFLLRCSPANLTRSSCNRLSVYVSREPACQFSLERDHERVMRRVYISPSLVLCLCVVSCDCVNGRTISLCKSFGR